MIKGFLLQNGIIIVGKLNDTSECLYDCLELKVFPSQKGFGAQYLPIGFPIVNKPVIIENFKYLFELTKENCDIEWLTNQYTLEIAKFNGEQKIITGDSPKLII